MKIRVINRDGAQQLYQMGAFSELFEMLVDELKVPALCGGCCSCATCHVFVEPSQLQYFFPASEDEAEVVNGLLHRRDNSRLLCQLEIRVGTEQIDLELAPIE